MSKRGDLFRFVNTLRHYHIQFVEDVAEIVNIVHKLTLAQALFDEFFGLFSLFRSGCYFRGFSGGQYHYTVVIGHHNITGVYYNTSKLNRALINPGEALVEQTACMPPAQAGNRMSLTSLLSLIAPSVTAPATPMACAEILGSSPQIRIETLGRYNHDIAFSGQLEHSMHHKIIGCRTRTIDRRTRSAHTVADRFYLLVYQIDSAHCFMNCSHTENPQFIDNLSGHISRKIRVNDTVSPHHLLPFLFQVVN